MVGIADAFNTGLQTAGNFYNDRMLREQARIAPDLYDAQLKNQQLINEYYGPEHQAAIDYQNITNQYLPDKLKLANEYQGKVNKWYEPNISSEIDARNAETQYTPLKYAIQAENAMRNNSRFGGSYQYLKSVADLPADQKAIWMANPDNYAQYQAEIQNLHASMSNQKAGQDGSSLITPALLKKVGLESLSEDVIGAPKPLGVVVSQAGGLAAPLPGMQSPNTPATQNSAAPVIINVPQASPPQSPPMQGGMASPFPGVNAPFPGMTPMGAPPIMPPQNMGANGAPMIPTQPAQMAPAQRSMTTAPMSTSNHLPANTPPLTSTAATIAQTQGVSPQEANKAASDTKNDKLTPADRQLLGFQMVANKKSVDAFTTRRMLAGVTYEKLLGENQDRIAPAFENAAKYAGILGSGKLTIDRFRKDHPKEYQDYMWVTQDVVPNLTNNVRLMEGLSSTNEQRHALNDMYKVPLSWQSDPKMAINIINNTIKLFSGQAKAALEAGQPVYPGTAEKLYDLKIDKNSDYLGAGRMNEQQKTDIRKISDDQLMQMLQGSK